MDSDVRYKHASLSENGINPLAREYDALIEHCGSGVLVLDNSGAIQRANSAACRIFTLPYHASIGESLLAATEWKELHQLFQAARTTRTEQEKEIRLPGPDGGYFLVMISPIGGEEKVRPRFLLIARDVTELRRLERIRRDFVANVSHELRTPLASILAMAETLQDGAFEDVTVAHRFLGTIITEAHRLTRISQDLLTLADAEAKPPERAPLALSDLIEQVVRRFQPQAEKAEIQLSSDVTPGLEVLGNLDQLEQVIVNLVDNALKYTPEGGSVHVTAERQKHRVAVHVADTGIGIELKHLSRIFERFYRVDKARSRQSGGTGLGLSIVKHIVESHGGQVMVRSEPNRGSVFTFMLPAT
ncbi:MAG TPA: ATP-binding protein [Chthonomonadaceae bacterium]|nr:ATP-binding protein [Chthonomonadaceae bacterium]